MRVGGHRLGGNAGPRRGGYAGGPQDHLLSGNTISPLLVRGSHVKPAGVWSTNSYLKYEFVPADGTSKRLAPSIKRKFCAAQPVKTTLLTQTSNAACR